MLSRKRWCRSSRDFRAWGTSTTAQSTESIAMVITAPTHTPLSEPFPSEPFESVFDP